jgi:hypothetical protein
MLYALRKLKQTRSKFSDGFCIKLLSLHIKINEQLLGKDMYTQKAKAFNTIRFYSRHVQNTENIRGVKNIHHINNNPPPLEMFSHQKLNVQ